MSARAAAIGIDAGSTTCKAVAVDAQGSIIARRLEPASPRIDQQAERMLLDLRREVGGDPPLGATGYGRKRVPGGRPVTEISCHARGAFALAGRPGLLVDMGGQDTKAIVIGGGGEVLDFAMNDKCAAGTGRFLANAAEVMGIRLDEVGPLSLQALQPVKITTVCTVFVESDILSYLAQGKKGEDILGGVHQAIAKRTVSLARRVPIEPAITLTGGVARNIGMVRALEGVLGAQLQVSPDAHFIGAIGAAIFALEKLDRSFESDIWSPEHAPHSGN